ncbi:MAG: tRNA 2-thiouridine(34) synthase MnmA [Oscillospiraceae bacterium]|nr:tRNA 2-thiouridine(34) synthase MnmA [Oscillospiraceae bacterium]
MPEKEKVLIAMSGGVDSSVAALLMLEQGFDCIGCTMKLFDNEDACLPREHSCCSLEDVDDARSVCRRLGIPHYVFNYKDSFHDAVIRPFVESYQRGQTPNPCIDCNRCLKFGKLYERAALLGCRYVVTGHYARIEEEDGRFVLKKAVDETKDQSYVLYDLGPEQLKKTRFPLGSLRKEEVRRIAEAHGFINASKPDSQDICFVPDGDYAAVIAAHSDTLPPPGDFVDTDGRVLGRHRGIIHYTIGQRRGLGIAAAQPLYVCAIRPEDNAVVLGPKEALFSDTARVCALNWCSGEAPTEPLRCRVRIRYRHPEQPATLIPLPEGRVRIAFDEPQRAITPGQAAVFYQEDRVLGGGRLEISSI